MNLLEKENVYDSYCSISDEFSTTRVRIWNCVKVFLDSLESYTTLLEIGCGNGKNLLYRKDLNTIGTDFVPNMVNICISRGINSILANALQLPFSNNSIENAISVAVFHHLSTDERRKQALLEMIRIIKVGGRGLLVVWAVEQEESIKSTHSALRKTEIKAGDNFIRWHGHHNNTDTARAQRFYYFYDKNSFIDYINIENIRHDKIYCEKGNWVLEFTKVY